MKYKFLVTFVIWLFLLLLRCDSGYTYCVGSRCFTLYFCEGGPQISVRSSHLGSGHHFHVSLYLTVNSSVLVSREECKQVEIGEMISASVFRDELFLQVMRQRKDFPPVRSLATQATGCFGELSSLESRSPAQAR